MSFFLEIKSHYVAQADLELMTLLPQPPTCWDYRPTPLCPAQMSIFKAYQKMRKYLLIKE
jgi:hypothetical protein